jgi:hypothetical protein
MRKLTVASSRRFTLSEESDTEPMPGHGELDEEIDQVGQRHDRDGAAQS